jgi:phosphate transport system permease protein
MTALTLFLVIIALAALGYWLGNRAAVAIRAGGEKPHSLPSYYGWFVALWCGLPAIAIFAAWQVSQDYFIVSAVRDALPASAQAMSEGEVALLLTDVRNMASGAVPMTGARPEVVAGVAQYLRLNGISRIALWVVGLAAAVLGLVVGLRQVRGSLRARNSVERTLRIALVVASTLAILTTVGIVLSLVFEAFRFFAKVPPQEFLFGLTWSPQTAIRAEQVGASGAFGAVPLFVGTLLISAIAMVVAVPIGLLAAIYMSEYAGKRVRSFAKPLLEVLAGIPTVVYGFFAALTVAPFIRDLGDTLGLQVAAQSALAAGLVMGIMIIPFVSSLSDDVINAVPQSLREGSYGLGATQAETIKQVLLPAALPGIVASVILAFSRALGETMIVVMAAGLAANITINPLDAVTTVTVHIAALLVGDQEFDSAKTLSAFALGLLLFVVTLMLNVVALRIVQTYREKYD